MKSISLVILAGISPRVAEACSKQLRSNSISPISVKLNDQFDEDYLNRLLDQVQVATKWETARGNQIDLVLASFIIGNKELELEAEYFRTAARRLAMKPEWKNNTSSAKIICDKVIAHVQSAERKDFNSSVKSDYRILLPRRNCGAKSVCDFFDKVFGMEATQVGGRMAREVAYVRKKKSLRIRGVDFSPQVNNGKHPIRRCSDTRICDLAASFRFGVSVDSRMEFDVTCETGLRYKSFYQCDGTEQKITQEPTHLNMRINDDFEIA